MKLSKRVILFLPLFFVCFFMLSASSLAKTYEPWLPGDGSYVLVEDIPPAVLQDFKEQPAEDPGVFFVIFYDEQGNKVYESKKYYGYFSETDVKKIREDLLFSVVLPLLKK